MIEKNEILEMARVLGLNPDTVEKDYILGWMLFGIRNTPETSKWVFKGGTSLKKCFFETFRFSEDLDYTLQNGAQLDTGILVTIFNKIADFIHEEVGVEFHKEKFKFKILPKENDKLSAQGKIHYNGPLRRKSGVATIKLDLTTDEVLVLKPVKKIVHHPYSDEPDGGIFANCYAFEEVIAEKIRALAQRLRPRDLYDVIHFFRNRDLITNPQLVFNTLQKKCSYKKITVPTFLHIKEHEKLEELEPQWKHMLAHQLPQLPPIESFWADLEPFFDWLYGQLQTERLVSISDKDESIFQPGRVANAYSANSMLHKMQFAAANRVCVELKYNSKKRTVEPISFRTSGDGNRLFYGYERDANHPKAYSLSKIESIEITNLSYTEKYPVEINASGRVSMPPIRRSTKIASRDAAKPRIARTRGHAPIPKHRYECPYCHKRFRRSKMNSRLNKHKDKNGLPCYGKTGIYKGYT